MGSRVRKPGKKYKPVPLPPEREFRIKLESLEGEDLSTGSVTLDLRRIIPHPDSDKVYWPSRAVVKGAEQIHARMLLMNLETVPWTELSSEKYDSYCIASYDAIRAGLSEVITFEPVTEQEGS